ncbi:MAG: hypothetical protein WD906_07830 [Anaerolineales bacterium]
MPHLDKLTGTRVAGLGLSLWAGVVVMWATLPGIGLGPDSFDYVTAAASWADSGRLGRLTGQGDFRALTHFPPMYSVVLGAMDRLGLPAVESARWVNVVALAGVVLLGGTQVRLASRSELAGLVGCALLALSPLWLDVFTWAMSEPLFLLLQASSICCIGFHLRTLAGRTWLLAAGVLASLAILTRYAGLSLLLGGLVAVFLDRTRSFATRRAEGALYLLAGSALPMAWLARNLLVSGTTFDRVLGWHPPTRGEWKIALRDVLEWVFPVDLVDGLSAAPRYLFGSLLVVVFAVTLLLLWRRSAAAGGKPDSPQAMPRALMAYLAAHGLLLLLTVSVADRLTGIDSRTLAPAYVIWLVLTISAAAVIWRRGPSGVRVALGIMLGLGLASYAIQSFDRVTELSRDGQGYSAARWRVSQTAAFVRGAGDVPIYTNDLAAVYFLTGRTASFIPVPYNPATGEGRADYVAWLATMHSDLREHEGLLVIFGSEPLPVEPELLADLTQGLVLRGRFLDGAAYGRPNGEGALRDSELALLPMGRGARSRPQEPQRTGP